MRHNQVMKDFARNDIDRVVAQLDRSATAGLLKLLAAPALGDGDRDEIGCALEILADPRSVAGLVALGENRRIPVEMRRAALEVLTGSGLCPEGTSLRRWWQEGDDELRMRALIEASRAEVDIIGPVARDPAHPLHSAAIRGLENDFEEPEWQDCKIAALSHRDPVVRQTAAAVLAWDEPVGAEGHLHGVAAGSDGAAAAAIDTLQYYTSQATVSALHALARSADQDRAAAARESLDRVRGEFLDSYLRLGGQAADRLRRWMEPVWLQLAFTEVELHPEPAPRTAREDRPETPPPSSGELQAIYADPDGAWRARLDALHDYDWPRTPLSDRLELAAFFSGHPDPAVRDEICFALAAWDDTASLMALAHDPLAQVRQSAVRHLRNVPPSAEVARLTWDLISGGQLASVRAQQALETYVTHSARRESAGRLVDLALHDRRESIQYQAVYLLDGRDLQAVLARLAEPPLVTWKVHSMLLVSCAAAGIQAPPIGHLTEVDDLGLAEEIAIRPLPRKFRA
jgi:hypothetical protein